MKKIALFDAHCDCISRFQSNAGDTLAKSGGHLDLDRVSGFASVLMLAEWVGFEPTHALTRLTI